MSHPEKEKVLGSGRKYLGKEMHVSIGASRLREGKVLQESPPTCSLCDDDTTLYYCQTCSWHLCNICYQAHKRQKNTSNHGMIYIGNTTGTTKCLLHPTHDVTHYCKPCTAIACEECIYGNHRSHPYGPIDQCKQAIKNLCLDQAKEMHVPYDQIMETADNIQRKIDERGKYYQNTKSDLNARHSRLTNLLNTIHKENIDIITKEEQGMNGALQDVAKSVSQFRLKCDQTLAPIMSLVYSDDLNSVLQSIQQMQHQRIESYGVTNKLDQLQKNPIVKLSDSTGFLNIISDNAKQYLKVSHEMKLDDNYDMVVAIDLGRKYSGYTFSFKSDPEDIKKNKNWGAEMGLESYKAPTCVLTDARGNYKAFGYEAEKLYANAFEEDPGKQYQLFSNCTEILGNQRRRKGGEEMVSTSGGLFPAKKIIAMLLAFLKNHLMEYLHQHRKQDARNIRWVITLPATSLTMDTDCVRKAATMAGIIDDENSVKLLTVSAPQAASIYCRHIDFHDFTNYDRGDPDPRLELRAGTKYMIVDCGARCDIAAYQIIRAETQTQTRVSSIEQSGSQVDYNFIKVLENVLTPRFVRNFRIESPTQWLAMMIDFEKKKRSVCSSDPNASIHVQLAWALGHRFQQECGKPIDKAIKDAKHKGVTFANGMISLGKECLDEIFNPVTHSIVKHVQSVLKDPELKDLKHVFFVGGFCVSKYLQNAVMSSVSDGKRVVLFPNNAGFASMFGAVMYGHNPY